MLRYGGYQDDIPVNMGISQADINALFPGEEPEPLTPIVEPPTPPPPPVVAPPVGQTSDVQRILHISVPLTVVLVERDMPIEHILGMRVGTIIEFDASFDSELRLFAANVPIGKGHAVKVVESFGIRLTKTIAVEDRIKALGS